MSQQRTLFEQFKVDTPSSHLDVGCGSRPRNPLGRSELFGLDIFEAKILAGVQFRVYSAGDSFPFESETFDSVSAFDFLEHVPRVSSRPGDSSTFIGVMNEIYRILKPGGVFIGLTPYFPARSAFTDPTHVNFITVDTVDYFSGPCHARTLGYGFSGDFELVLCKKVAHNSKFFEANWGAPDSVSRNILSMAKTIYRRSISLGPRSHLLWILKK
jgi:SAM-dependent methyltransferase